MHRYGNQSDAFTVLYSAASEITHFCLCSTVTEKGYESESYSETEEDIRATKQAGKNDVPAKPATGYKQEDKRGHKKSSANANKGAKQASIMGFFQKK